MISYKVEIVQLCNRRMKMINSYATTAQIKNPTLGLCVDTYVGIKHHAGDFFHVYEGIAEKSKYIGLVRESDLKNGVI